MSDISPLAPERFPGLAPIVGVRLAAFACGIRYTGRDDLMVAELAPDSAIAGVFTRSLTAGAPVVWCRDCLPGGKVRGIVVNSGNSNTFTGRAGKEVVEGTYRVSKDEIEFTDEKGPFAGTGDAKTGTYKWKLEGGKLTFTKVKDESEGRSRVLTAGAWQRKGNE